ncbi:MAG: nucleotide-binding protein [Nitrospirae bacterium]|nr:nucleotide-binding protein [Fimbriimonadaceae bacterium]
MAEFKVFYSWQSDLPNATNRGFIGDALDRACKQIASNPEIEESPRLDQDTQGLPGAPLIPQAIMEKIDSCQAFVADVSLCYVGPEDTPAPNPNVIYELGYAVARLGWDRIILVMNTEFGPIEKLPFDLEKRRAIPYTAKEGEKDRSEERKVLVGRFTAGVATIARRQPIVPKRTPADVAIEAIENQVPARRARIRELWAWLLEELHAIEPDLRSEAPSGAVLPIQVEALKMSIDSSASLSCIWSNVCEAVALTDDADAAEAMTRGFEKLLEEYDTKPDYEGRVYQTSFDYWRFIGHEFFTVWIGCLLKEERWGLIDDVLSKEYYWEQHRAKTNKGNVSFDRFSVYVELFGYHGNQNRRLSYHADVLAERYRPPGIGSSLSFEEFVEGDLFLYVAVEFRLPPSLSGIHWRPWSVLYLKHEPRFLMEATSRKVAKGVKVALGEEDSEKVRKVLSERIPNLRRLWSNGFWEVPISSEVIRAFDTKGPDVLERQ